MSLSNIARCRSGTQPNSLKKQTSCTSSTISPSYQINPPSALISLTSTKTTNSRSKQPVPQNNNNAPQQSNSTTSSNNGAIGARRDSTSGGALLQPYKDYSKDKLVTSKPPLPSSALQTQPNLRVSQRSSQPAIANWANITTPRMRVPLNDTPPPGYSHDGRPVSPLTRGYHRRGEVAGNFGNITEDKRDNSFSQVPYNGQIFGGPLTAEGPAPLNWILNTSEHEIEPPPLPPGILKSVHFHKRPSDSTPSGRLSRTETEQDFLIKVLQAKGQDDTPFASHQESLLLSSPIGHGAQSSPSFPSSHALAQMEHASMRNTTLQNNGSVVGPFVNSGIPSQIQDDLLRIEMLLEFRKYKEALNQKIHNQNQLIQLVNSRSQLNSQQQLQQEQQFSSHHQHPLPSQKWHSTLPPVMDSPIRPTHKSNSQVAGSRTPDLTEEKPTWSEDITEPFHSPTFLINTFMEPHFLPIQGDQTRGRHQQQTAHHHPGDGNANDGKPINLLQPKNFDEFQALAEQSRSGFPTGMMQQQNPLLVGAQQYQTVTSPYQFKPSSGQKQPAEVTVAPTVRIQVASRERPASQQQPQNPQQGQQPTVQEQYQKYLLDRNYQNLSPDSFKMMESVGRDNMMMRKPVAVSLRGSPTPKSPNNLSRNTSPVPNDNPMVGNDGLDKPSPFFPGFSSSPIDLSIRSRDDTGRSRNSSRSGRGPGTIIEGVEELGNLLRQLPVLSRKEKVEEFQALSTLKPATPVTEAESETSMIPLVSSNGTLASERRPDTAPENSRVAPLPPPPEGQDVLQNVDPNKMNITELVTLGRKIYRILSQLSMTAISTSTQLTAPHQQQQVITQPIPLNVPSPNTPVFTSSNNKELLQQTDSGQLSPQLVVDFNTIPNPSFVAGPPKATSARSRTPVHQPPNLFRKVLHPPPTRWDGNGKHNRATATSNPPPSANTKLTNFANQLESRQQRRSSHFSRRSMSSLLSVGDGTSSGVGGTLTRSYTKKLPQPIPGTPLPFANVNIPPLLPDSFSVREKYSNNLPSKGTSKYKYRRQSTPYPYQESGTNMTIRSTNTTSNMATRSTSIGRRNFILENISKVRNMRKLPDSRVRPRQLPPVKKKYENVPSTIPGSRSRSNSANRRDDDPYDTRYRSASVPVTTAGRPSSHYYNRSVSTPRPSTGMSVHVTSSRSSLMMRPLSSHSHRPLSQGTLPRSILGSSRKGTRVSPVSTRTTQSKVKFGKLPSKVTFGKGDNVGESSNNKLLAATRKSRSKTKKVSKLLKKGSVENARNSSGSSNEQQPPQKLSKPKKKTKITMTAKGTPKGRKSKKHTEIGETLSTDDETPAAPVAAPEQLFKSESEQRMIREMVKAEMNLMVKQHVKTALQQKPRSRSPSPRRGHERSKPKVTLQLHKQQDRHDIDAEIDEGGDTEGQHPNNPPEDSDNQEDPRKYNMPSDQDHDDTTGVESGNLTPVYTPPRYYDESLFSLEKWINPDINSLPGSGYTSAKETPATTANYDTNSIYGVVTGGGVRKIRATNKPQTVRFSLPNSTEPQEQSNA